MNEHRPVNALLHAYDPDFGFGFGFGLRLWLSFDIIRSIRVIPKYHCSAACIGTNCVYSSYISLLHERGNKSGSSLVCEKNQWGTGPSISARLRQ